MIFKKEGPARIFLVLSLSLVVDASSHIVNRNNLENESEMWPHFGSCKTSSREIDIHRVSLEENGCNCDEDCARYGDCCFDSAFFNITEQKQASATFDCIETIHNYSIYMKKSCLLDWTEEEIRAKCENDIKGNSHPLPVLPVLGQTTHTAYRNIYCGICNGETTFFSMEAEIECVSYTEQRHQQVSQPSFKTTKSVPEDLRNFFSNNCTILGVNPNIVSVSFRSCIPNLVKTCPMGLPDDETSKKCVTYTSIVRRGATYFQNIFCAKCNKRPLNESPHNLGSKKDRRSLSTNTTIIKKEVSQTHESNIEQNDTASGRIPLVNLTGEGVRVDTKPKACIFANTNMTIRNGTYTCSLQFNSCDTLSSLPRSVAAKTLFFVPEQPFFNSNRNLTVFFTAVFFRFTEFTTSVMLMILHLAVFALSFQESTTFDKTIASLSFTELVLYSAIIFREVVDFINLKYKFEDSPFTCTLLSLFNQYCVLSICSWMLIIPFQIWHTTRLASLLIRTTRDSDQFHVYSLCGWVLPAVITLVLPLIDVYPGELVPILQPKLGGGKCIGIQSDAWLALILFVYLPVALALILCSVFLTKIAYLIRNSRFLNRGDRDLAGNCITMNFRFWLKLVSLMGLGLVLLLLNVMKNVLNIIPPTGWEWEWTSKLVFAKLLGSCMNGEPDSEFQGDILKNRGCFCDEVCGRFGDCCFDSPYFNVTDQKNAKSTYECLPISHGYGIYVKRNCPKDWANEDIFNKCRQKYQDNEDHLVLLPTLSEKSQTMYRNAYCALCSGENKFRVLNIQMECQIIPSQPYHPSECGNKQFKSNISQRGEAAVHFLNSSRIHCDVFNFTSAVLRYCIPNIVNTCASNRPDHNIREKCETYTSIVYDGKIVFKNPYCAFCNNKFFNKSKFRHKIRHKRESRSASHADQPSAKDKKPTVSSNSNMNIPEKGLSNNNCSVGLITAVKKKLYLLQKKKANISLKERIRLAADWDTLAEDEGEFRHLSDQITCETNEECRKIFRRYTSYPPGIDLSLLNRTLFFIANTTCLNFSIFFLMSHLLVIALTSQLWNPSNKIVTSFCLSLLIGNIFILIGQFPTETFGTAVSVLTYYSLLVHYSLVLTMSADVWRTTYLACSQSREPGNSQEDIFLIYSILSLVIPSIAALISLLAHLTDVDPSLKPRFGRRSSWFGRRSAMVVYFAVPVGIVIILSTLFLLVAVVMFFRFRNSMVNSAAQSTATILRTYTPLILMAKLTWVTGFFSYLLESYNFWIGFMILKALQSLFIFIFCTGKENIISVLYRKKRRNAASRAVQTVQREAQALVSMANHNTSRQISTETTSV